MFTLTLLRNGTEQWRSKIFDLYDLLSPPEEYINKNDSFNLPDANRFQMSEHIESLINQYFHLLTDFDKVEFNYRVEDDYWYPDSCIDSSNDAYNIIKIQSKRKENEQYFTLCKKKQLN